MISEERLEELIEQGETIFILDFDFKKDCQIIREINLKGFEIDNNTGIETKKEKNSEYVLIDFDEAFETKAEAEWQLEFGCIERTERLELFPTLEELINKYSIGFTTKAGYNAEMIDFVDEIHVHDGEGFYWTFERTKEGYTLACRKCKELFLGTEDEK